MKKIAALLFLGFMTFFCNCDFFKTFTKDEFRDELNKVKLKDLVISNGSLTPDFNKDRQNYNLICNLNVQNVIVKATAYITDTIIKINGTEIKSGIDSTPISLNDPVTNFEIELSSSLSKQKNKYTIIVYKLFDDTINWNKKISDNWIGIYGTYIANSIAVDSNDNIYIAGTRGVIYSEENDWWIKKFRSDGEECFDWNKIFNELGVEIPYSITVDSFDNVYVAGYRCNTSGGTNWWIKKFYPDGKEDSVNWNKIIESGKAYSIAVDSNNNVYVAGFYSNLIDSYYYSNWCIKKFNSNGIEDTINWDKKIAKYGNDIAYSIKIDSNDNVYVTGKTYLLTNENFWCIKKFDSNGIEDTINWDKKIITHGDEFIYSLAIDSNDNIYAGGYSYYLCSDNSDIDWWIKKFNSNGIEDTVNWDKKINSGLYSNDKMYSLVIDSNNNVYAAGHGYNLIDYNSSLDWWIKKFDQNGIEDTVNWNLKYDSGYNGNDTAYSIVVDSKNNIYAAGNGYHDNSGNTLKCWWIKKFINQ